MGDITTNTVWDSINTWHLVLPPSRPSTRQLAFIRDQLVATPRDLPVCVLGATPEFRDLLFELGFTEVVLIDRSAQSVHSMTRHRIYESPEQVVIADWRDAITSQVDAFAAILSDLTMGNLPYEDRPEFYAGLARALMPNGTFIDRLLMHTTKQLIALPDITERYGQAALNLMELNRFNCEALFRSELITDGFLDSGVIYDKLRQSLPGPRLAAFITSNHLITPAGGRWWYGRDWSIAGRAYCQSLNLMALLPEPSGSAYHGIGETRVYKRSRP